MTHMTPLRVARSWLIAAVLVVAVLVVAGTGHTVGAAPSPTSPPSPAPAPAASPTPAAAECRPQSAAERPSRVTDDIVDCVITQATPTRVRLTVAYTYASPLGNRGIWMGVDVLAGGNRLKWFGYRPAAITGSTGTATIEIVYGQNAPPKEPIATDQIELFMYVGGGQIFYRRTFALKHEWKL